MPNNNNRGAWCCGLFAGLVALSAPTAQAATIVTNGGFETGDFTGFTLTNVPGFTSVQSSGLAHGGTYEAQFGNSFPLEFISQILPTVAGASYNLQFFLRSPDVTGATSTVDEALVNVGGSVATGSLVGGTTLSDRTNLPGPTSSVSAPFAASYAENDFTFTAATNATNLIFGFANNPSFFFLDDISVTAQTVPEPGSIVLLGVGLLGFAAFRYRPS